jgi:hypothetical protein
MVCAILFNEAFYKMVHWGGWCSCWYLVMDDTEVLLLRALPVQSLKDLLHKILAVAKSSAALLVLLLVVIVAAHCA